LQRIISISDLLIDEAPQAFFIWRSWHGHCSFLTLMFGFSHVNSNDSENVSSM